MKLKEQFFDFEVFPNWWCCVIGKYPVDEKIPNSIKNDFIVIDSDNKLAREKLLEIICDKEYCNFGYNIKYYDNVILNGIVNSFTPHQLKILNDIIINPETQYNSQEHLRIAPFARKKYYNFVYQDMFDDNSGSLKEKEACMQLDIRESTVDFNKEELTDSDKLEIIDYCKHDVWSGMQFYKQVLKPFVATKLLVGEVFNIPMDVCYKSTNAKLAGIVLDAKRKSLPDSEKPDIKIPKKIEQYVRYALPKTILDQLCASPEKFSAKLFGNEVEFSNGGIHSIPCKNLRVFENEEWTLVNVDASSFYSAIMLELDLCSRCMASPDKLRKIYDIRLDLKYRADAAKVAGDKVEAKRCKDLSQAYKLILNTTSGAMGNKWLDLYDEYMRTSMCRVGQMLLAALANNIYNQIGNTNVQIVQTNTDGILLYIRRTKIDELKIITDIFTENTKIIIEHETEEMTWQRDVNNYILYKKGGELKSKGGYFVTDMIQPGHNRVRPLDDYVCREAVKEYFKTGKDIVEYIYNEKDISKFVITCSKGNGSGIIREFRDGRPDEKLHKVNRVYASMDKSLGEIKILRKRNDVIAKHKAPGCPQHCALINEALDKYNVDNMRDDIDYLWYIAETVNLLSDQWFEMQADKIIPIKIFELD